MTFFLRATAGLLVAGATFIGAALLVLALTRSLIGNETKSPNDPAPDFAVIIRNLRIGDLGNSPSRDMQVWDLLLLHAPTTLTLTGLALFLTVILGGGLSLICAVRPGSPWPERMERRAGAVAVIPAFAWLLLFVYGRNFASFNIDYYRNFEIPALFLPTLALALQGSAALFSGFGPALRKTMASDHATLARTWGYSEGQVLWRGGFRPAVLTHLRTHTTPLTALIGSVVMVEVVAGAPGLGTLVVSAVIQQDGGLAMWAVLALVALLTIAQLMTIAIQAALDAPGFDD